LIGLPTRIDRPWCPMPDERTFQELIQLARTGDQDAASELVRRFAPAVRRAARFRLGDARLARVLESTDICQSVLASFFVRMALGQYEIETPDELLRLLGTMARHKVANQVQRERAARRDNRRVEATGVETVEPKDEAPSPSQQVAVRDLLRAAQERLSPVERRVAELRGEGRGWAEIAAELGDTPEAIRKRFSRAVDQVAKELDLDG
jgi:RNA polymerase sigma-70 factor (ECF subfamily)